MLGLSLGLGMLKLKSNGLSTPSPGTLKILVDENGNPFVDENDGYLVDDFSLVNSIAMTRVASSPTLGQFTVAGDPYNLYYVPRNQSEKNFLLGFVGDVGLPIADRISFSGHEAYVYSVDDLGDGRLAINTLQSPPFPISVGQTTTLTKILGLYGTYRADGNLNSENDFTAWPSHPINLRFKRANLSGWLDFQGDQTDGSTADKFDIIHNDSYLIQDQPVYSVVDNEDGTFDFNTWWDGSWDQQEDLPFVDGETYFFVRKPYQ